MFVNDPPSFVSHLLVRTLCSLSASMTLKCIIILHSSDPRLFLPDRIWLNNGTAQRYVMHSHYNYYDFVRLWFEIGCWMFNIRLVLFVFLLVCVCVCVYFLWIFYEVCYFNVDWRRCYWYLKLFKNKIYWFSPWAVFCEVTMNLVVKEECMPLWLLKVIRLKATSILGKISLKYLNIIMSWRTYFEFCLACIWMSFAN